MVAYLVKESLISRVRFCKWTKYELPQKNKCEEKKMCVITVLHFSTLHTHTKKICNENAMYYFHSISILWNFTLYESNHWYLKLWIVGENFTFVCVFWHVSLVTKLISICFFHSNSKWIMILYNQTSHKIT